MDGRIDAVLGRLGIAHLADREPFALSGGEQQRVAIASIVAMGTRLLVLDEPTAQLDPAGTAAVATLLAELARDGTTILCAEHDPAVLGAARPLPRPRRGAGRSSIDVPGRALGSAVARADRADRRRRSSAWPRRPGWIRPHAFDEAARSPPRSAAARPIGAPARRPVRPTDAARRLDAGGRPRPPVRIAVDGLVHRYPSGVEALRGVSLAIEPGRDGRDRRPERLGQDDARRSTSTGCSGRPTGGS